MNPTLRRVVGRAVLVFFILSPSLFAAGGRDTSRVAARELTLYSGRGESLVAPLISRFESETGIRIRIRYAGTSELAVLLAEEADQSPADLFWAQDAGAIGALAAAGLLAELPATILEDRPDIFVGNANNWIATSGRARVLAFSPQRVSASNLPESVFDLSRAHYRSRVGWAPTNGSFQAFVTAMRVHHGEPATTDWLRAMSANDVQAYRNNTALVEAIAAGEIDYALTNNYYLLRFQAQDPDYPVAQRLFSDGDIGNLINVASVGVLRSSSRYEDAARFVEFLLSVHAQQYFTGEVYEYPVIPGVDQNPLLEQYSRLLEAAPQIDLDTLDDLEGTLTLLRLTGIL
jgi:iron(III) transport system substrate-binding protein